MNSPVKLSNAQLLILSAASQRGDRCLIAPKTLKRASAEKFVAKLLAVGLVREIKAKSNMPMWRRDEEGGQAFSLKLTAAGLKAIAIVEDSSQIEASADNSPRPAKERTKVKGAVNLASAKDGATAKIATRATSPTAPNAEAAPPSPAPRPGTKIARVIELLQRDQDATLEALVVATGWLPHTARAALTGLRHRGYDVRLERGEKGSASVYRIDVSPLTGS